MRLQFQTVDVFTGTQFVGNPLAVVLNAEGLSTGQMQAIAAEFNLAETTFVLPPRDAAHTAEVRIFTPRSEMPFAGHPNVGTAFVLARAGSSYGRPVSGERVIFEEKAGLVPIEILREGAIVVGSKVASPQPLSVGAEVAGELVASACGISLADIETIHHRPRIASCGAPFILAELKSRTALIGASPNGDVFRLEVSKQPAVSIMLYIQVHEGDIDIRARMFAPHLNIPEDPGDRLRQRRADRPARQPAPGGESFPVEDDRARRGDGTAEHPAGAGRKEKRHGYRDLYRRPLRAGDVRNDRSGLSGSEELFRTGIDDLPHVRAVLDLLHLGGQPAIAAGSSPSPAAGNRTSGPTFLPNW